MSDQGAERMVNAPGVVGVRTEQGVLAFHVRELPVEAEVGLRSQLADMALKKLGPGGLYANLLPVLKWMRSKEVGQHQDAAVMVATVAPLIARGEGVSDAALDLFRQSTDGCAEELFWRLDDAAHPDVRKDEVRAVVNAANALRVHLAMLRALDPKGPGPTPSDSPE